LKIWKHQHRIKSSRFGCALLIRLVNLFVSLNFEKVAQL